MADFQAVTWRRKFEQLKQTGAPKQFNQATADVTASLIFDAARYARFNDALSVLDWCRQWPGTTTRGATIDLGYFTYKDLQSYNRSGNWRSCYETDVILTALTLARYPDLPRHTIANYLLQARTAFPSPAPATDESQRGDTQLRADAAFERSIDTIARFARHHEVDDFVVVLLAYSERLPEHWPVVRKRSEMSPNGQAADTRWLWKKPAALEPEIAGAGPINISALHEFPIADRSLPQKLIFFETLADSIPKRHRRSTYTPPENAMLGNNAAVVVESILESLERPHLYLPPGSKQSWIDYAMEEIFAKPAWDASTATGKKSLEIARAMLLEFADDFSIDAEPPDPRSNAKTNPLPSLAWSIAFATLIRAEQYTDAEAMWLEYSERGKAIGNPVHPDCSLDFLDSLISSSGEAIRAPRYYRELKQFWGARKMADDISATVGELRKLIEDSGSFDHWSAVPYGGATEQFRSFARHMPNAGELPLLIACLREPWIDHLTWTNLAGVWLPRPGKDEAYQTSSARRFFLDITRRQIDESPPRPSIPSFRKNNFAPRWNIFRSLISSEWFTREEMLMVGPNLAAENPRGDFAWLELAILAKQAKRLEEAKKFLEKAGSAEILLKRSASPGAYRDVVRDLRSAFPDYFPPTTSK